MGLLDRLFGRTSNAPPAPPRVSEDGLVRAPDATPEEVINPPNRHERRPFSGPPRGWKRPTGTAGGGAAGAWDHGGGGDSGGGDGGGGDGGGGGGF